MIKPTDPRMYVVVREDLAFKYVQGSHGLAKYALEHPTKFREWNNEYIIYLSVFNGLALEKVKDDLEAQGFDISVFYEPDLRSDLPTAIAVFESGTGEVAHSLKSLRMATK